MVPRLWNDLHMDTNYAYNIAGFLLSKYNLSFYIEALTPATLLPMPDLPDASHSQICACLTYGPRPRVVYLSGRQVLVSGGTIIRIEEHSPPSTIATFPNLSSCVTLSISPALLCAKYTTKQPHRNGQARTGRNIPLASVNPPKYHHTSPYHSGQVTSPGRQTK
jgi:hypothetical protein